MTSKKLHKSKLARVDKIEQELHRGAMVFLEIVVIRLVRQHGRFESCGRFGSIVH